MKDFFISFNKTDRAWAAWIAWQLEASGHSVVFQDWDFGVACNFAVEVDRGLRECERLVAVMSPDYLASHYTRPEWAAYFADDPESQQRSIVPVCVREYQTKGLLRPIIHIDFLGKSKSEAKAALLDGVKIGRRKPDTEPHFPNEPPRAIANQPRFPGDLPPIWNVPHLRNPNFTEPGQRLTEMHEALHSGRPAALTQALAGLGGVGKTQLANEYAWRHAADYDLVWWLRAEDAATLAADFAALAAELDLPERGAADQAAAVAAVRRALRGRERWLLVFDNANAPDEVRPYLPGAGGHVLITSRHAAWGALAQKVEVKKWESAVAVEFLLKRTGQAAAAAAAALAQELDHLPLALEQAAAYVEATGGTLAGYVDLFRHHRLEVLGEAPASGDYPASVATTWDLSFQRLEAKSPAGAALLHLCAFLAPDAIPRAMILAGAEHLPLPLRAAAEDEPAFDQAVRAIRDYSLLDCVAGVFSMHRLVQAVVRERLDAAGRRTWAEAAVRVVDEAFPYKIDDVQTWEESARLLPHAAAATDHAEAAEVTPETAGRLLNQMGLYLRGRAEYAAARAAFERALRIDERVFGPEHPSVATMVNNLGNVLQDQGDLPGARAAFERALRIDEKVFGPEHPEVATDVNNLGNVLQDQGDLPGARAAFERALRIDEKVFGPEHPEVATDVNNLGGVLRAQGDLPGARAAFERGLRIDEKVYGREHPNVAIRVNNLGLVLQNQGDLPGARAAFERALRIDEKVYGPEHPKVAIRVNNLGLVLQDQGDLPGARAAFERALAIRRRFLGDDHPSTKSVLRNLRSLEP